MSKFKAISSANLAILLTLTPSAGFNSYLVIAGPTEIFSTFAETPKLYNVFCNFGCYSSCSTFCNEFNKIKKCVYHLMIHTFLF
mgnify:CR=1 FL=1